MYASFTPSGLYAVELNNPADVSEDFYDLSDRSAKSIQVSNPLRSQGVKTFDRGCLQTDITAKITKQFASLDDAMAWFVAIRTELSCVGLTTPSGSVTLTSRNHDGSTGTNTVPDANVSIKLLRQLGLSFEFEYHIQGGEMT